MSSGKVDAKAKRYLVVADLLRTQSVYVRVDALAKALEMPKIKVSASISHARRHLAEQGVIVVNRLGQGYKVGDYDEFVQEVDKSCKRALAHMLSMSNLIVTLRNSGKITGDLDVLQDLVVKNLREIEVVFESPKYEDYLSVEEFKESWDSHKANELIKPEFIDDWANEDVET